MPAEALFDVGEAAAYWLWQISRVMPGLGTLSGNEPIEISLQLASDPSATKPWVVGQFAADGSSTLEVCGLPDFETDGAPNAADRVLVKALAQALGLHEDLATQPEGLLEEIVPLGNKKMLQIFEPTRDPLAWPGRLGRAWSLADEAEAELLDELGTFLVEKEGIAIGPINDDQRTSIINTRVVPWLIDRLTAELASLEPDDSFGLIVERNEALISSSARDGILLPARLACFGPRSDEVERIETRQRAAVSSALASRFLVEYAAAFPPTGNGKLTQEIYDRLLALSSEIVAKGMLSDSIQHGLSNARLSILGSRRLGVSRDDDHYAEALNSFALARAEDTLADAQSESNDGIRPDRSAELAKADELAIAEFGFSYSELANAAGILVGIDAADESADVVTIAEVDLVQALRSELEWSEERVRNLVERLVLEANPGDVKSFWKQGNAVRPWRFNRERSYLRRPLVRHRGSGTVAITFGRRSVIHVANYWFDQYHSGRLQAETPAMRSALSQRRKEKGHRFEKLVAQQLSDVGLGPIRLRLRRIGPHDFRNIDGQDLGDIDVVAADVNRRELWLIEVKDLEFARTPAELTNEVANLIGEGNSAIRRLRQRATWVRKHLDLTAKELGVADSGKRWTVRPLVVVNEPLLSENLIASEIPIVAYRRLRSVFV